MIVDLPFRELSLRGKILKLRPYLILLFIPMLFTVLFGAVMSPVYVEHIPIAVFDMDNSASSRTIVDSFYDCDVFRITENYNTYEEIKDHILSGDICGAVILPEGFGKALKAKIGTHAEVLIDGSNFLISNNLSLYANTILATMNAGIQIRLLEAGGMVPYMAEQNVYTMNLADRALFNPQLGYFYYLFAGLLSIFVQQTFLAVTPTVLINEKLRLRGHYSPAGMQYSAGKSSGLGFGLGTMAYKLAVYIMLNTISMIGCLILANRLFAYPINGSLWYVMIIHAVFLLCLFGIALVLATLFNDTTHCLQFVMFMAVPSFLSCGFGWPEYMMSEGFAPGVKAVWPLFYYSNPLKDLMLKGASWDVIGHYIIGGLIFAAVWIPVGLVLYRNRVKKEETGNYNLAIDKE
jgi:ABC-2 type transport system permease protein